jgi:hypothetical protein
MTDQDKTCYHRCNFPNGRMRRQDGTTYPIACDKPAPFRLEGWWFCESHSDMVARGSLEQFYTDGRTLREAMERTALYNLFADLQTPRD